MVKHKYDCDIKTRKEQLELEQNAMVNRRLLNAYNFIQKYKLKKFSRKDPFGEVSLHKNYIISSLNLPNFDIVEEWFFVSSNQFFRTPLKDCTLVMLQSL